MYRETESFPWGQSTFVSEVFVPRDSTKVSFIYLPERTMKILKLGLWEVVCFT
jgi:hypothetical protein